MASRKSALPGWLILSPVFILVFLLLVHLLGVVVLRQVVEKVLHPENLQGTSIAEVNINLFTGLVDLEGFSLERDGRRHLEIGKLHLRVSPSRLLTGQVHIDALELERVRMLMVQTDDGRWLTGLPPAGNADDAPAEPPPFTVERAALRKAQIEIERPHGRQLLRVDELVLGELDSRRLADPVALSLRATLDHARVNGRFDLTLDPAAPALAGEIDVADLDWRSIAPWAPDIPVEGMRLTYKGSIAASPAAAETRGDLAVHALAVTAPEVRLALAHLDAPGLALRVNAFADPVIHVTLGQGTAVEAPSFAGAGITFEAARVGLSGELHRTPEALQASGLALDLASLKLQRDAMSLDLASLQAAATVTADAAGMPTRIDNGMLAVNGLALADTAAALGVQLDAVRVEGLGFDTAGKARLEAQIAADALRVTSAGLEAGASDIKAGLVVSDPFDAHRAVELNPTLEGLELAGPGLPGRAVSVGRLAAQKLAHAPSGTRVEQLDVQTLRIEGRAGRTALDIASLVSDRFSLQPDGGLALGQVEAKDLSLSLGRNAQGTWEQPFAPAVPAAESAPKGGDDAPALSLAGFRLSGSNTVLLADRKAGPEVQKIAIKTLEVGALDAARPDADTAIKVRVAPDKYAFIGFEGKARPLADKLHLEGAGEVNGFSLPSVNHLVANDLGHRFTGGHVDNDYTISIKDSQLEMSNQLRLHKIAADAIEGKSGPPINTAIALLENGQGLIDLDVPVSGDLADPNFKVVGALNPIIMKAVAGAAALAIQPAGTVLLVGALLAEKALEVKFAPVAFAPGSSALDAEGRKRIDDLAKMLGERPRLRLRLCGIAVNAELARDKAGKVTGKADDVLPLASQRANVVASALQAKGIGEDRVRVCRPAFEAKDDAVPRTDVML